MSCQVIWTEEVVEEFVRLGNLTKREERILRSRALKTPRDEQARMCHVCIRTVDYDIEMLKIKYDLCQKRSSILPKRELSKKYLFERYKRRPSDRC